MLAAMMCCFDGECLHNCWHVITELNVIYLAYFTLHWTCIVILHKQPDMRLVQHMADRSCTAALCRPYACMHPNKHTYINTLFHDIIHTRTNSVMDDVVDKLQVVGSNHSKGW